MIEFTATEIGCVQELGVISCGASNADSTDPYHYINFQREEESGGPGDEGVYFEIDGQSCGGYNIVVSCQLEPHKLTIELSKDFREMPGEIIVVHFAEGSSPGLSPIDGGLKKAFAAFENIFQMHI